jgi:PAT family beta-lactamase induction signal transducer AmpG
LASIAARGIPPLVESPLLRMMTVFLFYVAQGFPMGLFYVAIPAYMAGSGATPAEIASVVGMFALPWSLKLVNGFIIDRYTFLAMGRRRAWIIGAQGLMILGYFAGMALAPGGREVAVLAPLAFLISMATTFQDVSIDSLVIDVMTEPEQAKAGGIMFGAQTIGYSASAAASGYLIHAFGIAVALGAAAVVLALVLAYGISIRERPGERRFPWSEGGAHPRNVDLRIDAWLPLVRASMKAIVHPASLLFVPLLFIRSIPFGGTETYYPVLTTGITGWSPVEYTNVSSAASLGAAIFGLTVGGWMVSRIGGKLAIAIALALGAVLMLTVGLGTAHWSSGAFMSGAIWGAEFMGIVYAIAMIPLSMRLCSPAVAATQFTIYMAIGNFGRPVGAWLAGATTGGAAPQTFFFIVAAIFAAGLVLIWFFTPAPLDPQVEHDLAHGAGTAPVEN